MPSEHSHRWTGWYRVWEPDGFRRICRDSCCYAQEYRPLGNPKAVEVVARPLFEIEL